MSAVIEAKSAIRRLAGKANEIVTDPARSADEKNVALDQLETEMKGHYSTLAVHQRALDLIGAGETAPEEKAAGPADLSTKSLGEQIVASDTYASAVNHKGSRFVAAMELGTKAPAAVITEGTTPVGGFLNGNAGAIATPTFLPGIVPMLFQQLLVAELFAQGTTDSPLISYVKETTWNDNSAAVAEGALKPLSDDAFGRTAEQVGKIANTMKMTDEMVQDVPQAVSFLNGRLVFGVQRQEEVQLISGTGYPGVTGLLSRTGLSPAIVAATATTTPTQALDAIYQQVTYIRTHQFMEPDACLINPVDWQNIRLAKDKNNQYYAGGPFTGAYGNGGFSNVDSLWGLRMVQTTAAPLNAPIVGAFRQGGQIFRRQGITVEMTNSNEDDFRRNLIAVRAEERLALAIYRPGAFGQVTITWA